jgi:hypothetical protein
MLARAQGWEASLALCPGPGAAPALLLQPRV